MVELFLNSAKPGKWAAGRQARVPLSEDRDVGTANQEKTRLKLRIKFTMNRE